MSTKISESIDLEFCSFFGLLYWFDASNFVWLQYLEIFWPLQVNPNFWPNKTWNAYEIDECTDDNCIYTQSWTHYSILRKGHEEDTYRIREGEFLIKWWQINNEKNSHEYWMKQKSGRTIVCLILFLIKSNYSMCRLTVVGALFLCAQATNGRIFCDSDLIAEIRRHLKCDTKQI